MLREPSKWQTRKDLSTDARHRGGLVCSSDEAPVMGVKAGFIDRRGTLLLTMMRVAMIAPRASASGLIRM